MQQMTNFGLHWWY